MPRTTQQMRVLSPALSDAPGTRDIQGPQGVREDGTFARDERAEWFDQRSLQSAAQDVESMLAQSRARLGQKAPQAPELPLAARLAQRAGDKLLAELGATDSFEKSESSSEDKLSRRTTSTFCESLDGPKEGLFKRLLRRGANHGRAKK